MATSNLLAKERTSKTKTSLEAASEMCETCASAPGSTRARAFVVRFVSANLFIDLAIEETRHTLTHGTARYKA